MSRVDVDPIHLVGRLRDPDYFHIDWFSKEMRERDEALDNIPRFNSIAEMTHRPTVGAHSVKVSFFAYYIGQALMEAGVELDQPKLVYMGQHHDDAEIVTNDIPAPVKRAANRAERRRMQREEREAIQQLEDKTQKPLWMESMEALVREYRDQNSLESRIVNYLDKWDGLYESVNEVVCGENKEKFRKVIEEYRGEFDELNRDNREWHQIASYIVGKGIFEFPDPGKLRSRNFEDIDFTSVMSMVASIARDNDLNYHWWLLMNSAIFKTHFFDYVLPGWKDSLPDEVKDDFESAKTKMTVLMVRDLVEDFDPDYDLDVMARTGLMVPRKKSYELGESCGDTLVICDAGLREYISRSGQKFRDATGTFRAKGKYYSATT